MAHPHDGHTALSFSFLLPGAREDCFVREGIRHVIRIVTREIPWWNLLLAHKKPGRDMDRNEAKVEAWPSAEILTRPTFGPEIVLDLVFPSSLSISGSSYLPFADQHSYLLHAASPSTIRRRSVKRGQKSCTFVSVRRPHPLTTFLRTLL